MIGSTGPTGVTVKCYLTQDSDDGGQSYFPKLTNHADRFKGFTWARGPSPSTIRVTLFDALASGRIGHDLHAGARLLETGDGAKSQGALVGQADAKCTKPTSTDPSEVPGRVRSAMKRISSVLPKSLSDVRILFVAPRRRVLWVSGFSHCCLSWL